MSATKLTHLDVCHDPGEHQTDEVAWCDDPECEAFEAGFDCEDEV